MFCWTLHLIGGPWMYEHPTVAVGDKVYSFPEYLGGKVDLVVHVFNTVSLRWRKLLPVTSGRGERHPEVPSLRCGHTVVLVEDVIYLWGGSHWIEEDYYNELYAFDVDTHRWFRPRASGTVPEERRYHSACVLEKVMFIHGGETQLTLTNDTYKLDTTTMVWSVINIRGTLPLASDHHSATIIGTKMFVFGGSVYDGCPNIPRVFDTETNCWMNTPSAQLPELYSSNHSAFVYNGALYILGYGLTNDLWKLNIESFSWKKVEPKREGPVELSEMCCCMVGDRIILFGGPATPDDLFILDLSPSLKTLCKLSVIQHGLEQAGLTHDVKWELAAMTTNPKWSH